MELNTLYTLECDSGQFKAVVVGFLFSGHTAIFKYAPDETNRPFSHPVYPDFILPVELAEMTIVEKHEKEPDLTTYEGRLTKYIKERFNPENMKEARFLFSKLEQDHVVCTYLEPNGY